MKTRIITAILLSSSFLNALCITHQTHFPVDGDSFCEWDMEDMANTRLRLDYVGNRVYRNGTLERLGFENGYIDGDGTYCYCLRDWQGNNRVVLAGNDSIIESDNYYPYGQHFTEGAQAAYSAQRWKFGDKEFDAEKGLNWHDFGARFLMPQFGLFTTQDPLRHRNWHLSPYLYCAANPIRFIDPTGMDEWEIDKYGYITNHIQTKEHDAIFLVDLKGNRIENRNIKLDYGVIKKITTRNLNSKESFDLYKIKGDKNGEDLFRFFADNISASNEKIEFSLIQTGIEGKKAVNYITTSHAKGEEKGLTYLYAETLYNGYSIRNIIHSHPISDIPSKSDLKLSEQIKKNQVINNLPVPIFKIYHVPSQNFFNY